MSIYAKSTGPALTVFITAMIIMADYFVRDSTISYIATVTRNTTILLSAFALGVGCVNLMVVNYAYLRKRTPGMWMFGAFLLFLLPVLTILSYMNSPIFTIWYNYINAPVEIAIGSLLGYFIISGTYRTYKLRNVYRFLIIFSTIVVMLTNVPIGALIWPGFAPMGSWILNYAGVGGIRALLIVAAFGTISMGIRAILGYERIYMGVEVGGGA